MEMESLHLIARAWEVILALFRRHVTSDNSTYFSEPLDWSSLSCYLEAIKIHQTKEPVVLYIGKM